MAVLKCKMCGGSLEVLEGDSIAKCEYCGTLQTIPIDKGEKRLNLYERASHYRRNNDYDKALKIYEEILNEDTTDAEAYWSIILCKYGIEYVEDPATGRRMPTVNRTQTTSIYADEDYKSAIEYADERQREIYEAEAREIDSIQKGILEISSHEAPFDVFISYKETDEQGRRTRDSVLAQELYYGLTKEGFKVFFSRITLEDKLGSEYEPYIFAALRSAKVMVAIGTKRERFEAPWVKNEWSRFMTLTKTDSSKVLIPAYRDMDPYDLPEEFSHLQGQDMAKLGFMQDLVRGIKKIVGYNKKPEKVVVNNNNIQTGITAESLLARTYLFLEDGEYEKANEYVERILDINPTSAEGYLCNLLVDYRVPNKEGLLMCVSPLDDNKDYEKIMRFGSPELKADMIAINERIKKQNKVRLAENAKQGIYNRADELSRGNDRETLERAISEFRSLGDWKDAVSRAEQCADKMIRLERAKADADFECADKLRRSDNPNKILEAISIFERLGTYRNANELIADCKELVNVKRDAIYNKALALSNTDTESDLKKAKSYFDFLGGYRDARDKSRECQTKMDSLRSAEAEQKARVEKKNNKRNNIIIITIVVIIALVGGIITFVSNFKDDTPDTGSMKFTEIEGGYEVSDFSGYRANVSIPSELKGVPVISIGDEVFRNKTSIVSVNIPNSIKYIGDRAFVGCTSITSINLPASVNSIGNEAFEKCTSLVRISLPNKLKVIGANAFKNCTSLIKVDIPDSVEMMGAGVFSECTSLVNVNLSQNIDVIDVDSFYDCTSLMKITIPDGVVAIRDRAFFGCTTLQSIIIPHTVESVGAYVTNDYMNAKIYIELPAKPITWSPYAFDYYREYYYSESEIADGKHWHYVNGTPSIWH